MRIRCPHCHNPVEIIDDGEFKDLECTSCGSRFNLAVDVETVSHHSLRPQSIAHFRLLESLGTGSYGSVWKARDTELDRTVALKIPRGMNLSAEEQELFFREARAAAQLRHSNIVAVHEVGREDDTIYIASDYVDGANLRDWLSGQRLMPKESAQLCQKDRRCTTSRA